MHRCLSFVRPVLAILLLMMSSETSPLRAEGAPPLKLAILTSLTDAQGVEEIDGRMMVEGVRLAVEEANAFADPKGIIP